MMKLGVSLAAAAAAGLATALLLRRKQSRPIPPSSPKPASVYHAGWRGGFSFFLPLPSEELLSPTSMEMHQEVPIDPHQNSLDFVREAHEAKAENGEEGEVFAVQEKDGDAKIFVQEERDVDGESALLVTPTVEVERGLHGHANVSEVEVEEVIHQAEEEDVKVPVPEEKGGLDEESTLDVLSAIEVECGVEEEVDGGYYLLEVEVGSVKEAADVTVLVQGGQTPHDFVRVTSDKNAEVVPIKSAMSLEGNAVLVHASPEQLQDVGLTMPLPDTSLVGLHQCDDVESAVPLPHTYGVDQTDGKFVKNSESHQVSLDQTMNTSGNKVDFAAPASIASQPCLVKKPRTVSNSDATEPKGTNELLAGRVSCTSVPSHVHTMMFGSIPTPIFQDPLAGPSFPEVYVSHKKSLVPTTSVGYLNLNLAASTDLPCCEKNLCDISSASSDSLAGQVSCPSVPSYDPSIMFGSIQSMMFGSIPTPIFHDRHAGPSFPQVYGSHKKSVVHPTTSVDYPNQNLGASTDLLLSGASHIVDSSFKSQISKEVVSSQQEYQYAGSGTSGMVASRGEGHCTMGLHRKKKAGCPKMKKVWMAKSRGAIGVTS